MSEQLPPAVNIDSIFHSHVQNGFFFLDSDHLESVTSHLYGFSILDDRIVTEDTYPEGGSPSFSGGLGTYVLVERSGRKISITQDYNGSFGLYLFQEGDYFALSNSFLLLVDKLKRSHFLSLNQEYAYLLLAEGFCSLSVTETLVSQIRLLRRNAAVHIDLDQSSLTLTYTDHGENTVDVTSHEGIALLDRWFERWQRILKSLENTDSPIHIALSGGFDSRLTFMLALKSGIDLSRVKVSSFHDEHHTHKEDYEIASQIADYYHFQLNKGKKNARCSPISAEETLFINLYIKLAFHSQMYYHSSYQDDRLFIISGSGGECLRDYWHDTKEDFITRILNRAAKNFPETAPLFQGHIRNALERSFREIDKTHHFDDPNSKDYSLFLYRETRCRNHFGKTAACDYLLNRFTLSPLLDPDLHRLKLTTAGCEDRNLLLAVIYSRFCPDLLSFRFDSGKKIKEETIAFARRMLSDFPYHEKKVVPFTLPAPRQKDDSALSVDTRSSEKAFAASDVKLPEADSLSLLRNLEQETGSAETAAEQYMFHIFSGGGVRNLFTLLFPDEIYSYAACYPSIQNHYPYRYGYLVLGITKFLEDTIASRNMTAASLTDAFFKLAASPEAVRDEDPSEILKKIKNHITARIDVNIQGSSYTQLELLHCSDAKARITNPDWFQKNGIGYQIESFALQLRLRFHCQSDGSLRVKLRGKSVFDKNNKRIPYWIDYTSLTVNEKTQFKGRRSACHDASLTFTFPVKEGDNIELNMEWDAHLGQSPTE
ncbi:MAG: hypothetical protein IKE58_11255 [Blautia sp.]|nr:hypothetical protein [Blautia sp.]